MSEFIDTHLILIPRSLTFVVMPRLDSQLESLAGREPNERLGDKLKDWSHSRM